MRKSVMFAFVFLFLVSSVSATTYTCGSDGNCDATELQGLIGGAVDGDIIEIAPGTHTIDSSVTIDKSLTINGGGVYATTGNPPMESGTWPVTINAVGSVVFYITGDSDDEIIISGIRWTGSCPAGQYGCITLTYGNLASNWIIHDVFFDDTSGFALFGQRANHGGLIYNWYSYTDDPGSPSIMLREKESVSTVSGGYCAQMLMKTPEWGSENFTFVEDSVFFSDVYQGGSSFLDFSHAAKVVFRHNYIHNGFISIHGLTDNVARGALASEWYNNTLAGSTTNNWFTSIRSGTHLIHNNYVNPSNYYHFSTHFYTVERGNAGYPDWGPCQASNAWDGDGSSPSGYPCIDQIGRAEASGSHFDISVNTADIQPQQLWPAYYWDNTGRTNVREDPDDPYTTLGVDYYVCTDNCVEGVDYPAGYRTYTYPHPLRQKVEAEIIPSDRRINWDAGVRGGIPDRQTVCTTLDATGDTTDRANDIQTALNNCPDNQVVYLNPGTYYINSLIDIPSNKVLRGGGKGVTILKTSDTYTSGTIARFYDGICLDWNGGGCDPWIGLSSNSLAKDSTLINTQGSHGWSIGDYIMIDQLNDPNGDPPTEGCGWCGRADRSLSQIVQVTSVIDSDTVEIDPPLYIDYNINYDPQAMSLTSVVTNAGIESLTIDAMDSGQGGNTAGHLQFIKAVNCWADDVELHGVVGRSIWMYDSLWNTISNSWIHEKANHLAQYGVNGMYGIFLGPHASANLIENNRIHTLTLPISLEGSPAGNIIAYNYLTDVRYSDTSCRVALLGHGGHSLMNLVEGNFVEGRFGLDNYWGTHSHFTVFRNNIEQQENCDWFSHGVIDIESKNHYQNIIGNILGRVDSWETEYELYQESYSDRTNIPIYRTGYYLNDGDFTNGDTGVFTTMFRHNNFDYFNNGVVSCDDAGEPGCHGIDPNTQLPDSLYLLEKPEWWCDETSWPPVNPNGPSVSDIPAKRRYDNQLCTLSGSSNFHEADTNVPFGVIDITELMTYVTDWKYGDGSILMGNVIEAIGHWKAGSY